MQTAARIRRREFLKRSAAWGAVAWGAARIIPASAIGRDGRTAASQRVTLGSIGVGSMGRNDLKNLMRAAGTQVLAVCDVFRDRREQAKRTVDENYGAGDCRIYVDFRELLDRKDIDAVCITTQDHWHALIATAAAGAGKDVYCQKPLGMTVAECQAIRDAVRKHRIVFQTGTQQRSDRSFQFACELARNGYLGPIHTIEVAAPGPRYQRRYGKPPTPEPVPPGLDFEMYVGPAPMRPHNAGLYAWPDWYLIRDYCVGFIVNWGVHHLDIANWGCPAVSAEPCELEFTGSYRKDGLTDNIHDWQGEFRYPSGLRMKFSDTDNPYKQGCTFRGEESWLHVNRSRTTFENDAMREIELRPGQLRLAAEDGGSHYENFIHCVRSRKQPIAPVEAGHQASYLGMIAEISIRLGRKLNWDPSAEKFDGDDEANGLLSAPMRDPWNL